MKSSAPITAAAKTLKIDVVAGTSGNAFAGFLEEELRTLGVETPSSQSESGIIESDAFVVVVDEGYASQNGKSVLRDLTRPAARKQFKNRVLVADQAHSALVVELTKEKEFDPEVSTIFLDGPYGRREAIQVAQQIVDRLQSSLRSQTRASAEAGQRQQKMNPASGSARTRAPDPKERDHQFEEKLRLESGDATLGELLSSARFGRIMTESDVNALRRSSALVISSSGSPETEIVISASGDDSSKLTSLNVLWGYLLNASLSDESAGPALGKMVLRLLAAAPNRRALLDATDFWSVLRLKNTRAEIEQRSASDTVLNRRLSLQFGKLLLLSAKLLDEINPNLSFNSSYLLACIIGLPGEAIDRSATDALERLGASPRDLRPMFRDWLAIRHPSASAALFDRVLGVTDEEAKGAYSNDHLPAEIDQASTDKSRRRRIEELRQDIRALEKEWALPHDPQGRPYRDDLMDDPRAAIQKKIDAAEAELAQLESVSITSDPTEKTELGPGWHDGVAGIATGMVQFEDDRDVEDALKIEAYATRFARVIALRDTELPLSVGLFGEWGSGKTYFMKLLRQEVRRLAENNDQRWCSRVVPIRFNAWHYLDTNLWASLVTEMFDQLFDYLAGPAQDAEKRLEAAEKVMKEIENGKGAVSEVKEEVNLLEKEKQWAEKEIQKEEKALRIAERNANRAQKLIAARMDDLKALLPGILENSEWNTALKAFGLDKAVASWNQLERRLKELRSLNGRVRALGSAMGSGRWGLVSLVVLLVILALVPIALGKLAVAVAAKEHLQSITMAIGSASGLAVSLAG